MELADLMEVAVSEILKDQKKQKADLSNLIWELSLQNNDDEHYGDSFGADSEDLDDDFDDDDLDYSSDGEEALDFPTPTPTTTELSTSAISTHNSSSVLDSGDKMSDTTTMTYHAGDASTHIQEEENEVEEFTIIKGLSDKEARQSIYLRNGVDWVLPDVVPQLLDWNKGNQLTFTSEFERYIGRQIAKEDREDD